MPKPVTDVAADATVDAQPPVKHDPLKSIGVETPVHGVYVYVDTPDAFEKFIDADGKTQLAHVRRVVVGGKNYEHTTEDAAGCWIYRQM